MSNAKRTPAIPQLLQENARRSHRNAAHKLPFGFQHVEETACFIVHASFYCASNSIPRVLRASISLKGRRTSAAVGNAYFTITPHAMRSPEFPDGSDMRSSALAWTTREVPPSWNSELAPSPSVAPAAMKVKLPVPSL